MTEHLFKKYRTLEDYLHVMPEDFDAIHATGFFRSKTKNILAAAACKVSEEYGGVLPRTMEAMCTIPGVARRWQRGLR